MIPTKELHKINSAKRTKWTKEKCHEEALKYKSRIEFKNNSGGAYKKAQTSKWLDEICSHMIPTKELHKINSTKWTKEKCHEEALKYRSRIEFMKRSNNAYDASRRNGWLDEICSHMKSKKELTTKWTKDAMQELWDEHYPGKYDFSNAVKIRINKNEGRFNEGIKFGNVHCNDCNKRFTIKTTNVKSLIFYCDCRKEASKLETELFEFINSVYDGKIVRNDRQTIQEGGKLLFELDIYLPDIKVAIEFNGIFYHAHNGIYGKKSRAYHRKKFEACEERGIQLIQVWEDQWNVKKSSIKSLLKQKIGATQNRIFARKCEVKKVDAETARNFLDKNHLQGKGGNGITYGLFYQNKLLALTTFRKHQKHEWELDRFTVERSHHIVGGFSKLLKAFIRENDPSEIVSFSDNDISNGDVYKKNGFKLSGQNDRYFYVDKRTYERINRRNFQKKLLQKRFELSGEIMKDNTEFEIVDNVINKNPDLPSYWRCFSAGNRKWILNLSK